MFHESGYKNQPFENQAEDHERQREQLLRCQKSTGCCRGGEKLNRRIEDCRNAYRWILEQGPNGPEPVEFLVIAGDSAGGSNALGLLAWARDQRLRQADAGIAICPSTDLTLTAPSLRTNLATDPMLGPTFGSLAHVPKPVLWWVTLLNARVTPANPIASPLHGDLANLPPILVQASDAEMLFEGPRRYVAKAQAAGSPVELQTWPHMVHVWHFFTPELPEAEEAYDKIAEFLEKTEKHSSASRDAGRCHQQKSQHG